MRLTRRQFVERGAAAGAGAFLFGKMSFPAPAAAAIAQSDNLQKFIQPLRGVGRASRWRRATGRRTGGGPAATHYTIDIGQYEDQLHPDLPNPTRLRGFGQGGNFKHLGGIIAAKRGEPVQITFRNNLPGPHILPVDRTIMGADLGRTTGRTSTSTAVSSRGSATAARTPGGDPTGDHGPKLREQLGAESGTLAPNEAEYYYPNDQGARLVWYHDHAFGITRLNAYAGIASRLRHLRRLRARPGCQRQPARAARPADGLPRLPGQDLRQRRYRRRRSRPGTTCAGLAPGRPVVRPRVRHG